jgi:hypothetical protein
MNICPPALLYLILSIFSILFAFSMNVVPMLILSKLFFALLWTWFLNFLCAKGYKIVSWILVLFPFIIIMMNVLLLLTIDTTVQEGYKIPTIGKPPALRKIPNRLT